MKRFACLMMAFMLLLTMTLAGAEEILLRITEAHMELTDYYIVPARTVDGRRIVEIGNGAYEGHTEMKVVVVPDCITTIGDRAFAGCIQLGAILIPETVVDMGEDVFVDRRNVELWIVTPVGSTAAVYARENGIRCIELPGSTLAENAEKYIALALFSKDWRNRRFGVVDEATGLMRGISDAARYLTDVWGGESTLDLLINQDVWMLALNNLDIAFTQLLDWVVIPGDGNTYMADIYAGEIGQTLTMMTGRKAYQINTGILTDPAKRYVEGMDDWEVLKVWLESGGLGCEPVLRVMSEYKESINTYIKGVEEFTYVANFLMYTMVDYTECQEVLSLLQTMSRNSKDDTFQYAVNRLIKDYDTDLDGMVYKAIQEMLVPALEDALNVTVMEWAGTVTLVGKSTLGGVFGLYTLARKAIDVGLAVTGSASFREKQLAYVAMLEICGQAEDLYGEMYDQCDGTPDSLRKLQQLWEFNCCAQARVSILMAYLYQDEATRQEMVARQAMFEAQISYPEGYYAASMMNDWVALDSELVLEQISGPVAQPEGPVSLGMVWEERAPYAFEGDDLYLEWGYEAVESTILRYSGQIPLGRISWGFWDVEGDVDAWALFDDIMAYYIQPDALLWRMHQEARIVDVQLMWSELYQYEKWLEEAEYTGEICVEYYLFRGRMLRDDGIKEPFGVLFRYECSSEGESICFYCLLSPEELTELVGDESAGTENDAGVSDMMWDRYKAYLHAAPCGYMEAVVCDLDLDGEPEVVARYNAGRWGSECHVLDIMDGDVVVSEMNEMTFFQDAEAHLELLCLPDGQVRWTALYDIGAMGEVREGIWLIDYQVETGVGKTVWYYRKLRAEDLPNPGETFYIGDWMVDKQTYQLEQQVFTNAERLDAVQLVRSPYPSGWDAAVQRYIDWQN